MNWRERYQTKISSKEIKPEVGMRVKAIKVIERNEKVVGVCGTIKSVRNGTIGVQWDEDVNGHNEWTEDDGQHCWNGRKSYNWDRGHYQILLK